MRMYVLTLISRICCAIAAVIFALSSVVYGATQINGVVTATKGNLVKITFKEHKTVGPKHGDQVVIKTTMRNLEVISGRGTVKEFGHGFVWARLTTGKCKEKKIATIFATGKSVEDLYALGMQVKSLRATVKEMSDGDKMPKSLTPKEKDARRIAAAALEQEIKRSSLVSEPVMVRTSWDEDFISAGKLASKGLSKEDVDAQRRTILLESFSLNSDRLAEKLKEMGISRINDNEAAYRYFFKGIETISHNEMVNLLVEQESDRRAELRPYSNRIRIAYMMLPEDDQKVLANEYKNCDEEWFQFRMSSNGVERGNYGENRTKETRKRDAMAEVLALKKFQKAAKTMALAAKTIKQISPMAINCLDPNVSPKKNENKKSVTTNLNSQEQKKSEPQSWDDWDAPSPKAK